jgi:hypothetical protein
MIRCRKIAAADLGAAAGGKAPMLTKIAQRHQHVTYFNISPALGPQRPRFADLSDTERVI